MESPAVDLIGLLVAESSLGLTLATDLHVAGIPDDEAIPDLACSLFDLPGPDPDNVWQRDRFVVAIRVRGAKNGYAEAYRLAAAIREFLHGRTDFTIGGSRYLGLKAQGGIAFLAFDDNRRPILTLQVRGDRTTATASG